jgi:prepilin signal peptidase PulO-like enzyme (type II secretory pathway)
MLLKISGYTIDRSCLCLCFCTVFRVKFKIGDRMSKVARDSLSCYLVVWLELRHVPCDARLIRLYSYCENSRFYMAKFAQVMLQYRIFEHPHTLNLVTKGMFSCLYIWEPCSKDEISVCLVTCTRVYTWLPRCKMQPLSWLTRYGMHFCL